MSELTPEFEVHRCASRSELQALVESERFRRRSALELMMAWQHRGQPNFEIPGFCLIDKRPVAFQVDWLYTFESSCAEWLTDDPRVEVEIPNWRERLICPICGLNNRQRAIASQVLATLEQRSRQANPRIYLTEQVTPLYRLFQQLEDVTVQGSEFLGPGIEGGTVRDGIRHEDVEALSFEDASLDLVLSCSVLEHVNDPLRGILQMARVLKQGGELFLEIPFAYGKEFNTRRARRHGTKIEHLLPAQYHGDPLSPEGVLVYMDFGWEFVQQIRDTGYLELDAVLYWSLEHGHLGAAQLYFHGRRTELEWQKAPAGQ